MKRRHLLYLGSTSLVGLPLLAKSTTAAIPTSLQYLIMRSGNYAPAVTAGDYMLVDSNLTHFSGEGIYLYPAWGAPSPYLVRKADATSLAFCHPASGAELWRQTLIPTFAGKLEKVVAGHDIAGIKQLHQQLTPVAMQPAS